MTTLLLAGTKKGLFTFTSDDRRAWRMRGPCLPGKEITHAMFDSRTRQIFATANDAWFGCEIMRSPDLGETWTSAELNPAFAETSGLKLERLWHLEAGLASEPDVLYAGVAPAALFRTEDGGKSWREVAGLTAHPTRRHWHPGAGGLCLHSIVVDERAPRRLFVAISASASSAQRMLVRHGRRRIAAHARNSSPATTSIPTTASAFTNCS